MIPLQMVKAIQDAKSHIKAGDTANGVALLDDVYRQFNKLAVAMDTFAKMEILGSIAHGYRMAGATLKDIQILEELCSMALADLDRLGLMASSEDIRKTAIDLAWLGLAYLKENRKSEAQKVFMKAKELFTEIEWEMDVDENKGKVYFGPKKRR